MVALQVLVRMERKTPWSSSPGMSAAEEDRQKPLAPWCPITLGWETLHSPPHWGRESGGQHTQGW